jgi:parallel beta-helix repeat protein
MRKISFLVLSVIVLLSSLLRVRFNLVEVETLVGTPVHNLDTGYSYATIQGALDAPETLDGHTILVDAGIYYEHVVVNKTVLLRGESRDTTFVDGNGTGTVVTLSPGANVTGFTIQNGFTGIQGRENHTICYNNVADNHYGGIDLSPYGMMGKRNNITGNLVANNSLFGICLGVIFDSFVYDNTVESNEHGLVLVGGNGNIFRNNSIRDNEYNFGVPIWAAQNWILGGLVNDIDTSNTVDEKPIYCWVDRHDEQIPGDAGYVWLTDCDNIAIKDSNLNNNLQGIFLVNSTNILAMENNVSNNVFGIFTIYNCVNSTFIGNNVSHNHYGIYLGPYPAQSTFRNNCMDQNVLNFGFFPTFYTDFGRSPLPPLMNDIDTSNTINGKPTYYWVNQHDRIVPEDAGYVALINSTDIVVENLNMSNNLQCVLLMATNNTVIRNISIANSSYGIAIEGTTDYTNATFPVKIVSFNNTVTDCVLRNSGAGIQLGRQSQNNTVSKNVISTDLMGIAIYGGSGNLITENMITNNTLSKSLPPTGTHSYLQYQYPELPIMLNYYPYASPGVLLDGGPGNILTNNLIAYNDVGQEGGSYSRMGGNILYHNNFVENTIQVVPYIQRTVENKYSSGYPEEGNYWSNYNESDANRDGIGDTPYRYYTYDVDPCPLMGMFHRFNTSSDWFVNVISNSSIDSFEYFESDNMIKMYISNMTADQTYGFCRLRIPHALMNETYHVSINGTEPSYWNYTLYDDGENRGIYFSYQHSTLEIIIVPEFPMPLVLPLLVAAALLAVAVKQRKHV